MIEKQDKLFKWVIMRICNQSKSEDNVGTSFTEFNENLCFIQVEQVSGQKLFEAITLQLVSDRCKRPHGNSVPEEHYVPLTKKNTYSTTSLFIHHLQ